MKTIGKILIGVGCVAAVGALAGYGLKKLMEKASCCGCCDGDCECDGDGYMGTCDCYCHKKVDAPVEQPAEAENVADVETATETVTESTVEA